MKAREERKEGRREKERKKDSFYLYIHFLRKVTEIIFCYGSESQTP